MKVIRTLGIGIGILIFLGQGGPTPAFAGTQEKRKAEPNEEGPARKKARLDPFEVSLQTGRQLLSQLEVQGHPYGLMDDLLKFAEEIDPNEFLKQSEEKQEDLLAVILDIGRQLKGTFVTARQQGLMNGLDMNQLKTVIIEIYQSFLDLDCCYWNPLMIHVQDAVRNITSAELQELKGEETAPQDLDKDEPKTSNDISLPCKFCEVSETSLEGFQQHLREFHQVKRPFICPFCENWRATRGSALDEHLKTEHPQSKFYVCEQCDYRGSTKKNLSDHCRYAHKKNPQFTCPTCNKICQNQSKLDRHKISHAEKGQLACQKCGKLYRYSNDLKWHEDRCKK